MNSSAQVSDGRLTSFRSKKGALLAVAMLFSVLLGVFLATFLSMSDTIAKRAERNFYRTAAVDLSESGVEYAMRAFAKEDWSSWSISDNDCTATFSGFQFRGDTTGTIKVLVQDYDTIAPMVISRGTVELFDGTTIEKWMRVTLARETGSKLFQFGLLVRDTINASGGTSIDSWSSDPDNDETTAWIPYDVSLRDDNASVASASTGNNVITLGSSKVYGTAYIGSDDEYNVTVGWGGQVGPLDPNEWDPEDTADLWMKDGRMVSTGSIFTEFTAEFEEVEAPATDEDKGSYLLPYGDDSLGVSGQTKSYSFDDLTIRGDGTLEILGDVTIVLPANSTSLQIQEEGKIKLGDGATLAIYTEGNIQVSGAGFINNGPPKDMQIWGTSELSQNIQFLEAGTYSGVIYAPQANVKSSGGTHIYGALVANSITLEEEGLIHFDEALKEYTFGGPSMTAVPTVSLVEEIFDDQTKATYTGLY